MMTTVEGIVLKERRFGEGDKFIDILTKDRGVIELPVRGAGKIAGKSLSSSQLFAYSRFCYQERKNRLYLNSVEPIHIFYGLRSSLSFVSLASYFSEVVRFCVPENSESCEILRLLLNTLHYLEKNMRDESVLKSIFELRLMAEIGYMPDVVGCQGCGSMTPETVFFSFQEGGFLCGDCAACSEGQYDFEIDLPTLLAARHIVLADFDRLFNFRISERTKKNLSLFTEKYLISHLERNFNTLDFYKSIMVKKYE